MEGGVRDAKGRGGGDKVVFFWLFKLIGDLRDEDRFIVRSLRSRDHAVNASFESLPAESTWTLAAKMMTFTRAPPHLAAWAPAGARSSSKTAAWTCRIPKDP